MEPGEHRRRRCRNRKYGSLKFFNSPQVYIKLRPTTDYANPAFRVLPDGKTLELRPPESSRKRQYFVSDGVLQDLSQRDVFAQVVEPLVDRAMSGISGVILSLGPQGSGKNFTFYGDLGKYENRGLLPRSFEKIFQFVELSRTAVKYTIRVGMVALWKNKIRDLISLSPYELKSVGDSGPNGMLFQPIECADHGHALLMRGVAGVKLMNNDQSTFHTLVYIDIEGQRILSPEEEQYLSGDPIKFTSRLTFAKIASLPQRSTTARPATVPTQLNEKIVRSDDCVFITPAVATPPRPFPPAGGEEGLWRGPSACCHVTSQLVSETISVRRDLLFLEQMFIRMRELQEAHRCYRKVISQDVRMQGVAEEPEVTISSQHFRQNKLCHCLRDLVSSRNQVHVLLHLRPEHEFLQTVSDALRFAARLRSIPRSAVSGDFPEDKMSTLNGLRQEIRILREELDRVSKAARGELSDAESPHLSPSHFDFLQQQAMAYLNGKIEQLDVESKAEAKALFENFRSLFQTAVTDSRRKSSVKSIAGKMGNSKQSGISMGKEISRKDSTESDKKSNKKKVKSDKSLKRKKDKKNKTPLISTEPSENLGDSSGKIGEEEILPEKENLEAGEEFIGKMGFASKEEALEAFATTETGSRLAREVATLEILLQESMAHQAEAMQITKEFLKTVVDKEAEFEGIQEERHSRGDEYDLSGNLLVPKKEKDFLIELRVLKERREQLLTEMKVGQAEVSKQKSGLSSCKSQFESQFQLFCLERFTGIREDGEEEGSVEELEHGECPGRQELGHAEFCNLFGVLGGTGLQREDASRNFSALQRAAQEQAKEIAQYYQMKPPWRTNYK